MFNFSAGHLLCQPRSPINFSHGEALGTPDEDDWPEVRELPDYPKVSFAKRP